MLWIALYLPLLSLETLTATLPPELRQMPLALVEARQITHANASAQALGVKPGCKRATALGLAPQLIAAPADPLRDAEALQAVLHACLAFTPAVTSAPPLQALLEVQASLRYFGGFESLLQRLQAALAPLVHETRYASAPTAQGAALLARMAGLRGLHCPDLHSLRRALDVAPVRLLASGSEHREALQGMGLRTLADLRGLPRAGLARRFGEALLDEIDRAFGERADPRLRVSLAPSFETRLELFARADTSEQVLHGTGVLLARLVAWLSAQHAFVRRFTLQLQHEARWRRADTPPDTAIEIALAAPSRDSAHLLLLLRERLGRTQLVAPALELRLHADDIVRAPPPNSELFPTAQGEREGLTRLVERLQARLGRRQVQRPARVQDHRPERSSVLHDVDAAALLPGRLDAKRLRAAPAEDELSRKRRAAPSFLDPLGGRAGRSAALGALITRPVWLIEPPQPLHEHRDQPLLDGAALQLLSGPERIETGWWDQGLAGRDYFIAQAADASLVWVYRLRLPGLAPPAQGWYLHGRFA
jgi:protein ImuB